MATIGDAIKGRGKEIEIIQNEIAVFLELIQERKHPLDLVRELLSNAGAREVEASHIEISYTRDKDGHIFEVSDDGCGMDYTGIAALPGRLDKFLGLGMSAIVGEKSDEFSWKGLGSKLAYHSKRIDLETHARNHPLYTVVVNDPWGSLQRKVLPRPRITDFEDTTALLGTRIKVTGHPPHRLDDPFSFDEIRTFLLHRTFAGYTMERANPPTIVLSVVGRTETLKVGFPEFAGIQWPDGIHLDDEQKRLFVNITHKAPGIGLVRLKGFLTWDASRYMLSKSSLNTGLLLASRGIPYFELDIEDYGARGIPHANPGIEKTCLVVECDGVYSKMNISRSDLVDSPEREELRRAVRKLFDTLESSAPYLQFRKIPGRVKQVVSADHLAKVKREIESEDQNWVIYQGPNKAAIVLIREPENETEVGALIWKLEMLGALPFAKFQTLAYVGATRGPDLLAHFQEESGSEPIRGAVIEIENSFYNYAPHGHKPAQYPKVICWDIPTSGHKTRLSKVPSKPYKFTVNMEDYQVHVYAIKLMDGIKVMSRRELQESGIEI